MNFFSKAAVILTALALIVFISFLLSYPTMLLWNGCLVGAISGVNEIGWLQAWGISALCGLLFTRIQSNS
jgi:hypothetical protein